MKFQCKKVENCFEEARTYEYRLPITGGELAARLPGFQVTENRRFRRPVFSAKKDGVEVKGILEARVVKINYTAGNWEEEKKRMEQWLERQETEMQGETQSVCPVCLRRLPAGKVLREKGIYLAKDCPEHGHFETLIWEGSRESYEAWGRQAAAADSIPRSRPPKKGCPFDCGLCSSHERRGCCVLLEVTSRCNLGCPVCFARSGGRKSRDVPLSELEKQMRYLMEYGGPFNLQLSGGEPTLREDLGEIIRRGREIGFTFFQLNTNGIRLAEEPEYAAALKEAGLSCVFLQFDGLDDHVYRKLRGRPLLETKKKVIEVCRKIGLGAVLVPVIAPGINEDQMGAILSFARDQMPVVRGVHFQPVSYFGRCIKPEGGYRLTIPKLLSLMEEQTGGWVKAGDFAGGNATNPYCTFQANYRKQGDGSMRPLAHGAVREGASSEQAREAVARQWKSEESCCCGGEPQKSCCCGEETAQKLLDTSSLDDFLAEQHRNTLAVSGMLFQDAWNLDLERLRRCYILETDLRYGMVPFCAYNLTSAEGRSLYR